jgi:putative transposase
MNFEAGKYYHIYNRSFEKTPIFLNQKNYNFFIKKLGSLNSCCSILAYCLMPNHFHLLIYTVDINEKPLITTSELEFLPRKIGTVLSSYTQAFNKQNKRTGSLFQPKTKSKELTKKDYSLICFHYIHQNPFKAKLVSRLEDWEFSSFNEYNLNRDGICDRKQAVQILDLPHDKELFYKQSYTIIQSEEIFKYE